jgi:hypothetical protein
METTNLLNLITKDNEEIDSYLGSVSPKQFVLDVKSIIGANLDKELIKDAIQKLEEFL